MSRHICRFCPQCDRRIALLFYLFDGFLEIRPCLRKCFDSAFFQNPFIQRIVLYYGDAYGMQIQTRPNKGCITTLTLPKVTEPIA